MAKPLQVRLTLDERAALEALRDRAVKPCLRERAAVILKIADGYLRREVAEHGLLRPRSLEFVSRWVQRYKAEGIAGLQNRPGQGRKPAFSP